MNIRRFISALSITFILCCPAQAQEPAAPGATPGAAPVVASKEYFVQQQADEAIVVRVAVSEAEFVSRLMTADGEIVVESGLPGARMLPLFQFVAQPAAPRQIDIDVTATQVTDRTEFALELIRLNVRDQRSGDLANAYRLLSMGLESLPDGNLPSWTVKIQTLIQAGSLFADIGMEEMRLWCRVYAAHLVLHELRDHQTALDWAEQLLAAPRIDRFGAIAFAASKIRSTALAGGPASAGTEAASSLQRALEETVRQARSMGFRYEEALALQAGAVDLQAQGLSAPALQRLNEALGIAEEIGAADLAAAIREDIVGIHEQSGDLETTGNVLQDIEAHLLESGGDEELARNLLRQGRLLLAGHRYADAIEILSRAASPEQSNRTRIETELALGAALFEAGRNGEALVHLYRGVIQPESGDFRRPSPLLNLASALGDIAAIHRQQGDFGRMAKVRGAQQAYLGGDESRARWAYERGLDALAEHGPGSPIARRLLQDAFRQGSATDSAWGGLSLLRLCALPDMKEGSDPGCGASTVRQAYEANLYAGSERQAAEAAMLYSRLLGLRGETGRALEIAAAQVEALQGSGRDALGAWYWQWREYLFGNYLDLAIRAEAPDDASGSLLALARARAVERGAGASPAAFGEAGLRAFLQSLPRDSAVLSYFLGGGSAQAWIGRRSGVRRIAIPRAGDIRDLCRELRRAIEGNGRANYDAPAAALGRHLLDPVAEWLPGTVFWVAHGELLGIPLDSLPLNGAPLAASIRLVQLDRFPAAPEPGERLRLAVPAGVFLAGDPLGWSADYPTRVDPSAELRAVTERFVGPDLHTVQGVALLRDEFDDPRYGMADLVHLSIPGTVDLSAARASALLLSEPASGEGPQRLHAATLRNMPLRAGLVFLSRTGFGGSGSVLESDLGVVSAALAAGAGAAIATLWAVDDESRSRLVANFYQLLAEHGDAATALAMAKRAAIRAGNGRDWAGFQLFLD